MKISTSTDIQATPANIWKVIGDPAKWESTINGIAKVEVLEQATGPSLVGLKWEETRLFMGKPATEVMWVTEAKAASFYKTRAESHGSVYESQMAIERTADGSRLTMSFAGTPQTTGAKMLWALTGWMAKGAMRKTLAKDLADIKAAVEG